MAFPGSGANRTTITLLVDQLFKIRPFRADTDLAKERIQGDRQAQALDGIAASIRQGPDTGGGVQQRKFLWSLYNQHHLANLWSMTASLDSQLSIWIAEVFTASLTGVLTEDDLKHALVASGEMSRWDQQQPGTDALRKLQDAEKIVSSLAQATLPSHSHIQLADLLRQFGETKRVLGSANPE